MNPPAMPTSSGGMRPAPSAEAGFRPCLAVPDLLDDHVVHPVIPKTVAMPVGPSQGNLDHIVHACHGGRDPHLHAPANARLKVPQHDPDARGTLDHGHLPFRKHSAGCNGARDGPRPGAEQG